MRRIALTLLLLISGVALAAPAQAWEHRVHVGYAPRIIVPPPPETYMAPHGVFVTTYNYAPRRGVVYDSIYGFAPSYVWPTVHRIRAYRLHHRRIHHKQRHLLRSRG